MNTVNAQVREVGRLTWGNFYPIFCIFMLAIAPAIFLGDGNRNLGLIIFMYTSPVFLILSFNRQIVSVENLLILGFVFSLFFSVLFHEATRWSTIFYSIMFCSTFISYVNFLHWGYLGIPTFLKVVRFLIIAYTTVLLIQQLCVLFSLQIFNLSNYDPQFPWKLNSLSSEPSHSARIVGLLMFTHIVGSRLAETIGEKIRVSRKQSALVWTFFLWTMITMFSATSVAMLFIVVVAYLQKISTGSFLIAIVTVVFALIFLPDELLDRALGLASAAVKLDYEAVLRADHSGGMRVAPMLILLERNEIFSKLGLFGNGVDSVSLFMSDYIWGVPEGFSGGGLLSMWFELGFIPFACFILFSLKATDSINRPINFFIWAVMIFIAGINTQMVWLAIILLYTLKYFDQYAKVVQKKK